jgi:excinuclease ABC subunit C
LSDEKHQTTISQLETSVKEGAAKALQRLSKAELLSKANTLPKSPGCYFMYNKHDEVIYVGKAKNLKSRVVSYFNASAKSAKTQILVGHIVNFDFILTDSDVESYVLENNLIKQYYPKYNIRMKDDKSYPYISVDLSHDFPKLDYVRRPKKSSNKVLFGPFPVGSNISSTLRILTKALELRDCSNYEFKGRKTACILHQMHQCSAPCIHVISKEDYAKDLEHAMNFLKGNRQANKTLKFLNEKMHRLAEAENFEQAAMIRDFIDELTLFKELSFDQNVELNDEKNVDIISFYKGADEVDISLYLIRSGNLLGHKNFHFPVQDMWEELSEEVMLYMLQYYSQLEDLLPDMIIIDLPKEEIKTFEKALQKSVGENIRFKVKGRTKKYDSLLESTLKHAQESQRVRIENQQSVYVGLNRLKELLKLKNRPKTLECYDVAIWQGKSPTASQVVFYEGKPEKKDYRYYHLEELPEGNNDFAMMREVFNRRIKHMKLPDVFIVDGGVAQVNTVKAVLEELDVDVPVVGIAKARNLTRGQLKTTTDKKSEERLIIPGRSNPYILNKCPSLFRIVVQMRDEAHRFSRKLHHKAEKKRIVKSWLDDVKGIGPKTRDKILQHLEMTQEELAQLNVKELQDTLGIEIKHAKALYEHLHALRR